MSERIQTLLSKFKETESTHRGAHVLMGLDEIEKFAELIVKECMDLALLEQKRYAEFTHRDMSECVLTMSNFRLVMKDHFGVEE